MIEIHKVPDFLTGAKEAAQALTDAVMCYRTDAILVLFSGGSPLEMLQYLPKDLFDDRITIGVSDERYSTDPTINNFAQVQSKIAFNKSIDTRPMPGETLEQLGVRFDCALKKWRSDHPSGKIIITQGIGLDGHTAGMMPGCIFDDPNVWAIGYDAKEKNKYPLRVTTTVPLLTQQVDLSIVFVCGEDKQTPLSDVLASKENLSEVPGRVIHHMKHCLLYTDCAVDRVGSI
jgi:6-phosphogluconolactonase/glucosamine-6-phosphate isomerase/deaminase